jgi:DNA-binding response OmpR family regulator
VRVLLAEDDAPLADSISRGLRRAAIAVDVAADGACALEKLGLVTYDVLVLDRDLPLVHGDKVCRDVIGSEMRTRILMLTASSAIHERVEGLSLGADDYLPKPFAMSELVARIRALGRRTGVALPAVLRWRDVQLDPARRHAGRAGRDLRLTNREFAVLEQLMIVDGAVLSAEALMERVWDEHLDPFSNIVRVTILTLRRKLGDPSIVETVPGRGYRLAQS